MQKDLKYWYLRNHRLFEYMSDEDLDEVCLIVGQKRLKQGDVVDLSDIEEDRIFILKKGVLKLIYTSPDGDFIIHDIIQQGDLFGELRLNATSIPMEFAEVVSEDAQICSISTERFKQLLKEKHEICLAYDKIINDKLYKLTTRYQDLVFKDASERILSVLRNIAEQLGHEDGEYLVYDNLFSQEEIAQMACTSRQTVAQSIKELQNAGIVIYKRDKVIITKASKDKSQATSVK